MVWFKVDDKFHSHAKVLQCSEAALGVWTKLGSWCAEQLNGGRVSRAALKHFRIKNSRVTELVRVGLWIEVGDEYQFHDWDDHQPSKQQVLAQRQATKARVTRHRNAVTPPASDVGCNAVTNAVGNAAPVPSRPVPEEEEELRAPPARDGSEVSIGHDLLVNATGIPYPPSDWRRELERIGLKPELERTAVLAAIRGDPWCRANKLAVDPTHVLKQWGKYAAGNPQLKSVVRAAVGGRYAGPSRVPTAAEYAADLKEKAPWET